ncbi:DUF413 domain-containing protein [Pseudoalteromonas xiamenensis]|uniref:Macrodomain Ori protein n=1 Tax=Pseudoalteromonas xiamenensis TaxID=882626 RepID=A0A975DFQ3_9GAMM|nr:DUF413 domain-containing protein [Pseudoalteromonas xiamenensis]QTH70724.1 DUF413 domain-containing protein [Pseudoalteromonas xiamenensis]
MNTNLPELRNAFASPKQFYDDANFPRGFARSGHFTILEAEILENHGVVLKGLYNKTLAPQNSFQTQFTQVMENTSEPTNAFERAWIKYLKLTTSKAKFHTLFGRSRLVADNAPAAVTSDDDY